MKHQETVKILAIALGLLSVVSCSKGATGGDGPSPTPEKVAITGEYSDVKPKSVTLYGWCNQKEEEGLSAVYGFEYSDTDLTTAARTVTAKSKSKDSSNKYSCDLADLKSDTKYYYRAYTRFNGITSYGDVKTFTTATISASVTANLLTVKRITATITGKLTVVSEGTFTKSAVFYYSSTASTLEALKSSGVEKTLTMTADGEFSILIGIGALERETKYYCVVVSKVDSKEFSSSVISFTTTKPSCPSGAVDLGLSVCWATCNIGASNPEEYGGYYQWAGTQDVTNTSIGLGWDNCPYHTGSSEYSGWTKYIPSDHASFWSGPGNPDNKTVLDLQDDVAHVKLGGKWRMPTDAEWDELLDNCTWTWTSNYNGTGVKGMIATSKKPGYTDKSIFLPAAGRKFAGGSVDVGHYWSSSLATGLPCHAYDVYFISDFVLNTDSTRDCGQSVRPVAE